MTDGILIPTDGTRASTNAIRHAVNLAVAHGATLYTLHVIDEELSEVYGGDGLETTLRKTGEQALEEVRDLAESASVDVETAIREGVPHEEIIAHAEEIAVDTIVVGTKERTDEQLLGSVTDRVARGANEPVTIVKTPALDGDDS